MSRVSVLTASVGRPALVNCIDSVANQTHKGIQHLVFLDGPEAVKRAPCQGGFPESVNIINLPYSVGKDRWNGHRAYGAGTFLADDMSDYIMFLDDDNTIDADHISSLVALFNTQSPPGFAYSLRKITDEAGNFLCNDDCESLGKWSSVIHPQDFFIDVNCWFLPRKLAIMIAPLWYRKFREPGLPEIDRIITANLINITKGNFKCSGKYTVNYAVGGSALSVQPDFFKQGNAEMQRRYPGGFPWTAE
jgi:glycosyltransferase involved in cell wall biosynthesis